MRLNRFRREFGEGSKKVIVAVFTPAKYTMNRRNAG